MAEVQCISHSATNVTDLKEAEEFYQNVFGGLITGRVNFNTEDAKRGRSVHTSVALNDWLFAICLPRGEMPMPPDDLLHGTNGFRHGFRLNRAAFGALIERLKVYEVPF